MLFNIFLFCVFYGSSVDGEYVDECYGRSFRLPIEYTPPLYEGPVYFTPRNGGPRKLLLGNGQARDPTVSVSMISVTIKDLRQSGTFSGRSTGVIKVEDVILNVLDCARKVTRTYRHDYTIDLPTRAEFLEYTLDYDSVETKVLWNRSDPQSFKGDRGKMTSRGWDFITLTQEDNGYYCLRKKDKTLLDRIRLTVEENSKHYDPKVGDVLLITNPYTDDPWTVTFIPVGGFEKQTLMEEGYLVAQNDQRTLSFSGRIQLRRKAIEIDPVEITDSGTFEYRDPQGNLAQVVTVEVIQAPVPTYVYAAIAGGIVLAEILCCCCVRMCCCKKGSSKRDESAPAAVYYHDQDQPAGQSYSAAPDPHYSYQPVNPPASRQPAASSVGPSVQNPVNIHTTPLQPEVSASVGQGAAPAPSLGSDCLSSAPPPMFELNRRTFPSVPPLGSESTTSDVYTSDKLNFL
ncbi:uncharacterized protein LOC115568769 [Sparus aurata]|uniref:uncharacterized protein LOC115568769 n=1 Tax=Sparus aurata TaxID=8175 RepID=UPI0011C17B92|nr:uncharacterized protein LOC115568769 [Sparus aurata]